MNITQQEYNQVINGLRMQLELHQRRQREILSENLDLTTRIKNLETIMDRFRGDLKFRREANALTIFKDDDSWFAVDADFINLQESPSWTGETPGAAIEKALRERKAKKKLEKQIKNAS